jgi:hypothetical protein
MKTLATVVLALPFIGCTAVTNAPAEQIVTAPSTVMAQPADFDAPPPGVVLAPASFTDDQLELLLGPIALYPDALIALILPASTASSDVDLAARYFQSGGDPSQTDAQPWQDSVRALAHYPDVIKWMADNLTWTNQLGDAFASQPAQVMNAVQRLRARARAAGTLVDTPQQHVIYQDSSIVIIPAQPDVIYVPYYDPAIVYAPPPGYAYSSGAFFNYSPAYSTGWWLSFGVDWHERNVWSVNRNDRERFWREHRQDWQRHVEPPRHGTTWAADVHPWRPPSDRRPSAPVPGYRQPRYADTPANRTPEAPRQSPSQPNSDPRWRRGPNDTTRSTPTTTTNARAVIPPVETVVPATAVPVAPPPPSDRTYRDWRNNRGHEVPASTTPPPTTAVPPRPPNYAGPALPPQYYGPSAPPYGRGNVPPPAVGNTAPPSRHGPPAHVPPPPPAPATSAPAQAPAQSDQTTTTSSSQPQPAPQPPPPPQQGDDDNRRRYRGRAQPN